MCVCVLVVGMSVFFLSGAYHFIWLDCADFSRKKREGKKPKGNQRKLYKGNPKKKRTERKKREEKDKKNVRDANVVVLNDADTAYGNANDHDYDGVKSELRNDRQTVERRKF